MALEEVKREILQRAARKVTGIKAQSATEIRDMKAASAQVLKEKKKEQQRVFERESERLRQRRAAESSAAKKDQILEKKRSLIEETVESAKEKLKKDCTKKKYLQTLLKKAQGEMNVAKVYCKQKGGLNGVKTESMPIDGLIAENKDGNISIDYSFDTLLRNIKEKNLKEISEVLFK